MAHLTREALAHFEVHNGIASPAQLRESGMSRDAVKEAVRVGTLELVLQGAYRLKGSPLTELGRCTAVCIAHPESVIAGPTAGRLWGFRRMPTDLRIHTLSPPHSHPTVVGWVEPYRTTAFHPEDIVTRSDGIVMTTRARTAYDLARFLEQTALLSVIEQAIHDGRHSVAEMRRVAADWLSPQRPWARTYLELIDRRLGGGAAESHQEVVLGDALARAGIGGIVRQYPIELPGYGRARFDLAVPELRWAIEVDVFPTHRETAGRESDQCRDESARGIGWSVSRIDESQFGAALPATVDGLVAVYQQLRTTG